MKTKTFSLCMIFFVLLICTTVTASEISNSSSDIATTTDSNTVPTTTSSDTSTSSSSTHTSTPETTTSTESSSSSSSTSSSASSSASVSSTPASTSTSYSDSSSKSLTDTSTSTTSDTSLTSTETIDESIDTSDDLTDTTIIDLLTQDDTNDINEITSESDTITSELSSITAQSESITTSTTSDLIEKVTFDTSSIDSTQVYEISSNQTNPVTSLKSDLKEASTYSISGNVTSAYDSDTGKYAGDELEGFPVANATVTLTYTSNGRQVAKVKTNANGIYNITGLSADNYTITFEYGTYAIGEEYVNLQKDEVVNYIFIPDLVIITYSGDGDQGQYNKYQALSKLSDRFLFLESYDLDTSYDNSNQWMVDFANFILVDMYAQGLGFGIDTDIIKESPASQNNMIAYTFGIYDDGLLMSLGWGYVGDSPYSVENTYIGSYWQAEAISDDDVVNKNMYNLYQYILYLLGEIDENPTDSLDGIPVLAGPQWGVYYPGFSIEVPKPTSAQIKQWIEEDPGYNDDGVGSLNWMTNYYNPWILDNQKPTTVFRTFENWYTANVKTTGPFVVIISYYETTAEVETLIKEFEANGQAAFCLYQYTTVEPTMTELLEIACTDKDGFTRGIVAGASLYAWSTSYSEMGTDATTTAYSHMNITILNGISGISQDSYESDYGPQTEWTYQVTVAEFEGVIAPIVISYVSDDGTTVVLDEGVAKLAQLTMGYANLKTTDNKDKKVAIILYDYPPGKANIGASYLDVYTSTHDLLVQLAEAGYDIGMSVEEIPTTEELTTMLIDMGNKGNYAMGLLDTYVEENYDDLVANHQLISESEWDEMYDSLPENLQIQLTDCWSTGLGNGSMIYNESYLVIPGMYFGNIFITVQPARGWDAVTDYHSDTLAPPQQYVAFYKYLYNYYLGIDGNSVDAMISMGTHGTLEWLPGRTMGLQYDDWTFQLTEAPIIYPYIVSNPGEGMTAKDRSFAQVITHMTPVMTASTLYGEYLEISEAISDYKTNIKLGDTQNVEYYKDLILNLTTVNGSFTSPNFQKMANNITNYRTAEAAGDQELMDVSKENILYLSESLNKSMNSYFNYSLPDSMTFDEYLEYMMTYCESDEAFDSWLSSIENTIESMSGDTITYGMHTLGYVWNDTEMVQGIMTIASSRTEILQHIQELYYNIDGDYYENIKDSDFEIYQSAIESTFENIVTRLVEDTTVECVNTIAAQVNQGEDSDFYQDLLLIKSYIEGVRDNNEWNAILTALDGGYVMPGLSGEPSLSDVLPTGRSMYSSDTTKMPTKAAWNTAVNAVDALLIAYMEDLGEDTYPELVGQVIWGTEVLRTEGVSLAMYLYLLGVTPVWSNDGTVTGVEVIPLEDLTITINGVVYQRPRIDVFATIVTSNTNWLTLLTDAVDMVNDLDESVNDNYVKKHYAEINSTFRLFGLNGAKLEGTGVSDLLNNIASWEDSEDGVSYEAASVYESRMDNAWTIDKDGNIQVVADQSDVFAYLLSNVDLIIQDIDSTWQYLDSDDYTDWYGGLLNAANAHGATPNTLLLDIRNKNEITTSTLSQQVSKEIMTTLTNPQWIQAMTASVGGWNQIAANYENMVKTIYTTQGYAEDENGKAVHTSGSGNSTGAISNELFTKTAEFMVYSEYMVADANYKSYAMQSILGWEMTLAMDGYWEVEDTALLTDLIQKYVDAVNQYGVACCHHTCGNVNLHEWILTTGSALGVKGLERYSEQYYSATYTGTVLGTGTSGTGAGDGSGTGSDIGGASGGTQIGDGSFTGYGDVGVAGGSGSYAGGGSGAGAGSGTDFGSMTGSGSGTGNTGGNNGTTGGGNGTNGGNGTTGHNGTSGGNGTTGGHNGTSGGNGTTGGNNGTSGNATGSGSGNDGSSNASEGNSNGDGSASETGGNSTDVGESSNGGESSAGGAESAAAESSSGVSSAASGATSASAAAYEVTAASGGEAASSQSEIGLGYILIIIGIGCLFAIGYRRRGARD